MTDPSDSACRQHAALVCEACASADAYEHAARICDREAERCKRMMDAEWHDGPKTDAEMANRQAWVVRRGGMIEVAKVLRAINDPDAAQELKDAAEAARVQ
jgi:hypothetical protein